MEKDNFENDSELRDFSLGQDDAKKDNIDILKIDLTKCELDINDPIWDYQSPSMPRSGKKIGKIEDNKCLI